ncbi:MAG: hypothetical protein HY870_16230 [Chloroflexi bacterium]|nr:hypothetical protein [Chloroflexota bacterium]
MRKIVFGLLALALGLGAGALIGWYVWPANTPQARPDQLRQDWKNEAVWMAAQAYAYDHDLEAALIRLSPLGTEDVGALVRDRAEAALDQNWPSNQIAYLARLAAALGARSPRLDSYLTP